MKLCSAVVGMLFDLTQVKTDTERENETVWESGQTIEKFLLESEKSCEQTSQKGQIKHFKPEFTQRIEVYTSK